MYTYEKKKINKKNCYILFITLIALISLVGNAYQNKVLMQSNDIFNREYNTLYIEYQKQYKELKAANKKLQIITDEYNDLLKSAEWITKNTKVGISDFRFEKLLCQSNVTPFDDDEVLLYIFTEAEKNLIDPYFAYAVWALETGWGTSDLWLLNNNPAGIISTDGSSDYQTYDSKEEGLEAMFALIRNYCDNGKCTVEEIRGVWSESDDADLIVSIWKAIIRLW